MGGWYGRIETRAEQPRFRKSGNQVMPRTPAAGTRIPRTQCCRLLPSSLDSYSWWFQDVSPASLQGWTLTLLANLILSLLCTHQGGGVGCNSVLVGKVPGATLPGLQGRLLGEEPTFHKEWQKGFNQYLCAAVVTALLVTKGV